jgi:hypothetical protein
VVFVRASRGIDVRNLFRNLLDFVSVGGILKEGAGYAGGLIPGRYVRASPRGLSVSLKL